MSGEYGAEMYMDEDAAVQAAMALSLVTAEEDDKRRKEKYGIIKPTVSREESRKSIQGSQVQLPKSGGVSKSVSPVPTSQAQAVPPPKPPPPIYIARPRPQASKAAAIDPFGMEPVTGASTRATNVPSRGEPPKFVNKKPPPLPSVGPNAKSECNTIDLVPTALPPPQRSPRLSRSEKVIPIHVDTKTLGEKEDKPLITLSPPGKSRTSDFLDFDLHSLDPLFAKTEPTKSTASESMEQNESNVLGGITGNVANPTVPTTQMQGLVMNPFTRMPQVGNMQSHGFGGFGMIGSHASASSNSAIASVSCTTGQASRTSPITVKTRPPPNPLYCAVPGGMTSQSIGAPALVLPKVPSGSHLPLMAMTPTSLASSTTLSATVSSNVPGIPKLPTTLPLSSTSSSTVGTTPPTAAVLPAARRPSGASVSGSGASTPALSSGDLMDFSDMNELADDFLRLESFDPLYAMDQSTADLNDSLFFEKGDLNGKVNGDFEQAPRDESESQAKDQENDPDYELMDPFSMDDLTCVLEIKRKKHEQEKAHRQSLLRKKQEEIERTAAAEQSGKQRRLNRRNSHIAKGRVCKYFHLCTIPFKVIFLNIYFESIQVNIDSSMLVSHSSR